MASPEERANRLRDGLLALGFLLLVGAAVWTVAVPELTKEPEGATSAAGGSAEGAKDVPKPVGSAPTH